MAKIVQEPMITPLGYQGEHYHLRVVWPIEEIDQPPKSESRLVAYSGLVLMMRPDHLPKHSPESHTVFFDVSKAWKDYRRANMPDTRECPGCGRLTEYDQKTWGNIAAGKGTLYGCELCVLKIEVGLMERIVT